MALIPTLDEVARDPSRAAGLPVDALAGLTARCAAVQAALAAAQVAVFMDVKATLRRPNGEVPADDRMLLPAEAAALLRRKRRWIYRNADRLPFVRRISRKSLLCSENGIKRWLERQGK
jgi:hypothetical protein